MFSRDEEVLNTRFADTIDIEQYQVLVANQPEQAVDRDRIFCRWRVNPGTTERTSSKRGR